MIRVALVDDETLVRQGIRSLLEVAGDFHVVGEAADGRAGVALLSSAAVDVGLLDVRLPDMSGIEVLQQLRARRIAVPIILLTTFDDDEAALAGIAAGASGFLLKSVSLERLSDAIRAVAGGKRMIAPAVTHRVLERKAELGATIPGLAPPDRLTDRELEILRLLAAGYSNAEIALALRIVEGTVKNHVSSILSKLGVRDRTRAVMRALHLGYL
jgi:DNA-binding NarL/FixJ family response regulator